MQVRQAQADGEPLESPHRANSILPTAQSKVKAHQNTVRFCQFRCLSRPQKQIPVKLTLFCAAFQSFPGRTTNEPHRVTH